MKYLSKIYEEASPRIPRLDEKGKEYWKRKGKSNKVMIYTHDDMDGIYSGITVKKRLVDLGYDIVGYGILNYMEGWKKTTLNKEYINVAVDFANMPNPIDKHLIDIYIDHHGIFSEDEKNLYSKDQVVKTKTGSAYEGICNVLGKPADEITLYSIDMIDSAKYDEYMVDWRDILNFSWDRFLEIANKPGKVTIKPFSGSKSVTFGWPIIAKLTFAGAFNQFLKRSDHKTVIEVIDNVKDESIYGIYNAMKKIYPGNNIWTRGPMAGEEKDFVSDSSKRISDMQKRTRGNYNKIIFKNQKDFVETTGMKPPGYQIIGNLMFVPSGTWANALRARSVLISDYDDEIIPKDHKINFILLQYGNTLQVCSVEKMDKMENYIKLVDGYEIKDLGDYMTRILKKFQEYFGYYEPKTEIGQEELTVSGGHVGIGTISNIVGKVSMERIERTRKISNVSKSLIEKNEGKRYLDLFKNKIIADLSGLGDKNWPVGLEWSSEDSDSRSQLIRDILSNHPIYKKRISEHVGDLKGYSKTKSEKEIKDKIKDELNILSDDEIEKLHDEAMMNHKVMMKDDIRKLTNTGKIPSRKDWEYMKSFSDFKK